MCSVRINWLLVAAALLPFAAPLPLSETQRVLSSRGLHMHHSAASLRRRDSSTLKTAAEAEVEAHAHAHEHAHAHAKAQLSAFHSLAVKQYATLSEEQIRLTANGNYDSHNQVTRYTPVRVNLHGAGSAKSADCLGLFTGRNNMRPPPEIRFTVETSAGSLTGLANAASPNGETPMFVPKWGAGANAFAARLLGAAPVGGGACRAYSAAGAGNSPRFYDPQLSGRALIVVVPSGDFAAWKQALSQLGDVHVVGVEPRGAGNTNYAHAAELWGFGWMRFATLKLMKELATVGTTPITKAWMVDGNVNGVRANNVALDTPAKILVEENFLAGLGVNVAVLGFAPDCTRNIADTGTAVCTAITAARNNNQLDNPALVQQAVLFHLGRIGTHNFPTLFPVGKEDKSFYSYLQFVLGGAVRATRRGRSLIVKEPIAWANNAPPVFAIGGPPRTLVDTQAQAAGQGFATASGSATTARAITDTIASGSARDTSYATMAVLAVDTAMDTCLRQHDNAGPDMSVAGVSQFFTDAGMVVIVNAA